MTPFVNLLPPFSPQQSETALPTSPYFLSRSGHNDGRSILRFIFHGQQCLVGLIQRKDRDARLNVEFVRKCEEIACVDSRHVRHAAYLSFAPEQLVIVEGWHLVKVNGIDRHHPTFTNARQCINYHLAAWRESDCAIQRHRRSGIFVTDPSRAEPDSRRTVRFTPRHDI